MPSRRLITQSLWQAGKALSWLGALALVLALLALTVGIAHIQMEGFPKRDRAKVDMQIITSALRLYRQKAGRLPSSHEGLQPLVDAGILEDIPRDPWGNTYGYVLQGGEVELRSLGSDGAPGGEGAAADIVWRVAPSSTAVPDAGT